MRVIEEKINEMISEGLKGKQFDRKLSKRDRVVSDGKGKVRVFLWDSEVASFDAEANEMIVDSCGFRTNTTKSRLNSLLWDWARGSPSIYQKNFTWFVSTRCPILLEEKSVKFQGVERFRLLVWR